MKPHFKIFSAFVLLLSAACTPSDELAVRNKGLEIRWEQTAEGWKISRIADRKGRCWGVPDGAYTILFSSEKPSAEPETITNRGGDTMNFDIVAIKQDGKVSCHYCDSVGFTQIPGFLPENPLKNAEMGLEDDYGMIDGIINNGPKEPTVAELEQQARSGQPISLMDLADAVHRKEREKKKSVMEQLKGQPKTEHKKTAPKKSAEREI